jgi:hypothetical protein
MLEKLPLIQECFNDDEQLTLQCMVDNNQDMSFLNDIKGLWVIKTCKGKEVEH